MPRQYNFKEDEIYGIYKVIDSTVYNVKNKTNNIHRGFIKVQCIKCGAEKLIRGDTLKSEKSTRCRKCSNREKWKNNKLNGRICSVGYSPKHQGIGDLPRSLYWHYKNAAKSRGHEFNISIEYLWELFIKQNKKCNLSGIDIKLFEPGVLINKKIVYSGNLDFGAFDASLDRIDSTKGYIEGNVQWVHRDINIMKNVYTQEHFINMCTKIALNQKRKKYECLV